MLFNKPPRIYLLVEYLIIEYKFGLVLLTHMTQVTVLEYKHKIYNSSSSNDTIQEMNHR